MKIVNRREFLFMPENTVFCEYVPVVSGNVMIKGNSISPNDYCEIEINNIDFNDTGDMFDKYSNMEKKGFEYPLELNSFSRNGIYDDNQLYLVYEKEDLQILIDKLTECKSVAI